LREITSALPAIARWRWANLLDRLAVEAEHGVLCTLRHHLRLVYSADDAAGAKAA
jgi:hypothetical protein